MIILDSNILKGTSLRGPEAELLRVIGASGERVAAPWIVLEELAAQQALRYEEKHEAAARAMDTLNKATPWETVRQPTKASPETVRNHWRRRYAEIAETIETSPSAYEQALFREANLLAPCKAVNSGKHKTGARDAAIWLTAVEYTKEHPQETVYFVSNNTDDFGDGSSFKYPMDEDLKGLEERFVLFTSLDGVLTKFATASEAREEEVTSLLERGTNRERIAEAAWRGPGFAGTIVHSTGQLESVRVRRWLVPPAIRLDSVSDIRAHEINGHKWCTATTRWLASGLALIDPGFYDAGVSTSWEARVLLSTTAPARGLTVLRSERQTAITREDLPRIPEGTDFMSGREIAAYEIDRMTHLERLMVGANNRDLAGRKTIRHYGIPIEDIDGLPSDG
ncbi:PIN domain-containing protein [Streptomyces sp. NPDC058232]|uniref:PIN domain-containing protein n=1 Tax=Streptomyces sp. NPDC058232 TaxID=3346393 RepID=UPI0036E58816